MQAQSNNINFVSSVGSQKWRFRNVKPPLLILIVYINQNWDWQQDKLDIWGIQGPNLVVIEQYNKSEKPKLIDVKVIKLIIA